MGTEAQIARVSHAAFYQLPEAGGIHRLQSLGLWPTTQTLTILISACDGNKGVLHPQAEQVQQEYSQSNAPVRQQATENLVAHSHLEQIRWDQTFMDRAIDGQCYLSG